MKRTLSLLMALLLALLVGCGTADTNKTPAPESNKKPEAVRIGGLTGPTSIGMVQMMEAADTATAPLPYAFTLAASADELVPKLMQGELDMVAIPANLAAVLYQNTKGQVCVLAINTLGVLSIVEKGDQSIQSLSDLRGKTIYATGQGSTPEYVLRYLLQENGLNPDSDVTIEFRSEPTEIVSLLASKPTGIAMLPQPFVTAAQDKVEGLRIAVDLTETWDALGMDNTLITGVMVARRDFVTQYPDTIKQFLSEYESSIGFSRDNPPEAAQLSEKFNIIKASIAERAIPHCNLSFLAGTEMKTTLSGYLEVLYAQNPASVGKTLPDDDFYYAP